MILKWKSSNCISAHTTGIVSDPEELRLSKARHLSTPAPEVHPQQELAVSVSTQNVRDQADTERSADDKSQSDFKEVQGSASDRHPVIDHSDYSEIELKDGVYSALSHCKSYESYETAAEAAEERSADDELTASEDQR